MAITESHEEFMKKWLSDKEAASSYLNAVYEDYKMEDKDSHKLFFLALKHVVMAQGGMSKLSKKTKLSRESLYKTLSVQGNPHWSTITTIIKALGIELKFNPGEEPEEQQKPKRARPSKKVEREEVVYQPEARR